MVATSRAAVSAAGSALGRLVGCSVRYVWNSSAAQTTYGLAQIPAWVLPASSAIACANSKSPGSSCNAGANRYAVPAGWVIPCVVLVAAA
jgi:hypothetical protein